MTDAQKQLFIDWLYSSYSESPLLFLGKSEEDLRRTINIACAILVCETQGINPCNTCRGCKQLQAGNFPDIASVSSEEKSIKRKEVQELLQAIANKPRGKRNLIIIPNAERLTRESATILLKSLEESKPSVRYVLTTRYKRRLLPTILSRLQTVAIAAGGQPNTSIAAKALPQFGLHQGPLADEELEQINSFLQEQLKTNPTSPYTLRSFLRFRDYCKIKSQRGNEKLAADVLLASLSQLMNTRAKESNF